MRLIESQSSIFTPVSGGFFGLGGEDDDAILAPYSHDRTDSCGIQSRW